MELVQPVTDGFAKTFGNSELGHTTTDMGVCLA